MDTRTKIGSEAPVGGSRTIAWVGYFDPLYSAHARRLGEIVREGERVVAIIADPVNPILPTRARAELVAGLEAVCQVIEAGTDVDRVLESFPSDAIVDDRQRDEANGRDLEAHVRSRQGLP